MTQEKETTHSQESNRQFVEMDALLEAVSKSNSFLKPQKYAISRLIQSLVIQSVPSGLVSPMLKKRAEDRDAAVAENVRLTGENLVLREEITLLERQVKKLSEQLRTSKSGYQKLDETFDGSIFEKRIFERMLSAYKEFVKDLGLFLEGNEIVCSREDEADAADAIYLVFNRLLGINVDELSPLEKMELNWILKDLNLFGEHEVDTKPVKDEIQTLEDRLKIIQEGKDVSEST